MKITQTCKCGARFELEGTSTDISYHDMRQRYDAFLDLHARCMPSKIVVVNNVNIDPDFGVDVDRPALVMKCSQCDRVVGLGETQTNGMCESCYAKTMEDPSGQTVPNICACGSAGVPGYDVGGEPMCAKCYREHTKGRL